MKLNTKRNSVIQVNVTEETLIKFNELYYKNKKNRKYKCREDFIKDMLNLYENSVLPSVLKF